MLTTSAPLLCPSSLLLYFLGMGMMRAVSTPCTGAYSTISRGLKSFLSHCCLICKENQQLCKSPFVWKLVDLSRGRTSILQRLDSVHHDSHIRFCLPIRHARSSESLRPPRHGEEEQQEPRRRSPPIQPDRAAPR